MFRFEKLSVWQKAIQFADHIYTISKKFPADERYGLTSQLRRAAVSISSNIAEGSGRSSDKEFAHFIQIAYGSLMEVVSQLQICLRQSLVENPVHEELCGNADELARMLSGLRASLLKKTISS
jgi:four helix bundle protein